MTEHFSTLTEAITYIFQKENMTILSLDRICQGLVQPNLYLQTSAGLTPCDTISRRRVSSILSSSELFVRAGPPRSCMWSLKPSNPLCLSDGALLSCINTILTENGPLTADGIIEHGDLTGATTQIILDFLIAHENEYMIYPESQTWWFKNQPLPERWEFDSVVAALTKSFNVLKHEASIEELNWLLCLSTLPQGKKISRRKISRELSRRPDLFQHVSRAKYAPLFTEGSMPQQKPPQHPPTPSLPQYQAYISTPLIVQQQSQQQQNQQQQNQQIQQQQQSLQQQNQRQNQQQPMPQIPFPTMTLSNQQTNQQINLQQNQTQIPMNDVIMPFTTDEWKMPIFEAPIQDLQSKMIDFGTDWMSYLPKCETPPVAVSDYFDPYEFFSVGFSGSFD